MPNCDYTMKRYASVLIIGLMLSMCFNVSPVSSDTIETTSSGTTLYVGGTGPKNYFMDGEQEIDLLRGETIFSIFAIEDVDSFNITYSVPPNYRYQAPIFFSIRNDSTANITGYCILNDSNPPNKIITFSIGAMTKNDTALIHFDFWVLVKNHNYQDLPEYIEIPDGSELPNETKTWLASTKPIQSDNRLIKIKARQLQGRNTNLRVLADEIVKYTSNRNIPLWRLDYLSGGKLTWKAYETLLRLFKNRITPSNWYQFNDAVCGLFWGGISCTGRANLGTALFRANGVPAKDLIVIATGLGKWWYDIHYICEYYCPNYEWISAETALGTTPCYPKYNIILRVNYPEDEDITGDGFDFYGGCEQWYWVDNEGTSGGAQTRGWIENEVITSEDNANAAFQLTQSVWEHYTQYAGRNLTGKNREYLNNATEFQKDAIWCLTLSDVDGYIDNIVLAYDEFIEIKYP